jgi:hypothetical protein
LRTKEQETRLNLWENNVVDVDDDGGVSGGDYDDLLKFYWKAVSVCHVI